MLADQVVKRGEKAIVWVLYPFEQAFVTALLRAIYIDARAYSADLTAEKRSELQHTFNTSKTEAMVLVCSYSCNGVGLNLHHRCHNVHLLDPAMTQASQDQAIGRTLRLGQKFNVVVIEYFVRGSFNERQVNQIILRSLPNMMAMIDKETLKSEYGIDKADLKTVTEEVEDVELGPMQKKFHFVEGRILKADDPDAPADAKLYDVREVLIELFQWNRGTRIVQHRGFGEKFTEEQEDPVAALAATTPRKRKQRVQGDEGERSAKRARKAPKSSVFVEEEGLDETEEGLDEAEEAPASELIDDA